MRRYARARADQEPMHAQKIARLETDRSRHLAARVCCPLVPPPADGCASHGLRLSWAAPLMGCASHGLRLSWAAPLMGCASHGLRLSWAAPLMGCAGANTRSRLTRAAKGLPTEGAAVRWWQRLAGVGCGSRSPLAGEVREAPSGRGCSLPSVLHSTKSGPTPAPAANKFTRINLNLNLTAKYSKFIYCSRLPPLPAVGRAERASALSAGTGRERLGSETMLWSDRAAACGAVQQRFEALLASHSDSAVLLRQRD